MPGNATVIFVGLYSYLRISLLKKWACSKFNMWMDMYFIKALPHMSSAECQQQHVLDYHRQGKGATYWAMSCSKRSWYSNWTVTTLIDQPWFISIWSHKHSYSIECFPGGQAHRPQYWIPDFSLALSHLLHKLTPLLHFGLLHCLRMLCTVWTVKENLKVVQSSGNISVLTMVVYSIVR